ncbi:MAG: rhodanese-like domain-containing protein [Gammaproteobacteria bacterium]|nr:rhodanese-like domain-containing protein [Gammaproteobacteria bacterium]
MQGVREISCEELAAALADDATPELIDVREPHEFAVASIDGSKCVPLTELGAALNDLSSEGLVVFICEIGERSRQAASFATMVGFREAFSLRGGVKAWQEMQT